MILGSVILIAFIQAMIYIWLERLNLSGWQWVVFLALMVGHFWLFPQWQINATIPDDPESRCGMPIFGITMAYWMFGGLSSTLIHFYFAFKPVSTTDKD